MSATKTECDTKLNAKRGLVRRVGHAAAEGPPASGDGAREAAPGGQSVIDATLPEGPNASGGGACSALREARLDQIAAGKSRLWRANLRMSEVANGLALSLPIPVLIHQQWSTGAAAGAALFAVGSMWAFTRWMRPREERLRRHIAFLARKRRPCPICGYCLSGIASARCPECGTDFDPADTRHILTPAAVQTYSHRARLLSAVAIIAVLFWVSALAQGAGAAIHVALGAAVLGTFHVLHLFWKRQSIRQEAANEAAGNVPPLPTCPDCDEPAAICWQPALDRCRACGRPFTPADTFIRPDARRPADPRLLRLQYQSLVLRWIFLVSVCGGLTAIVNLDPTLLYRLSFGLGRSALFFTVGIPVLGWVVLTTIAFRACASILYRRLKLLLAQIEP